MAIMATNSGGGSDFTPAPSGTWAAICVDVVDLGMVETEYAGNKKKRHKIRIAWQIEEDMEDGKPFLVQKRYTLSLFDRAALRQDLEAWRGRPFTEDEERGFDVEQVIGAPALLNVIQEAKGGKVYANIKSIMKLPKSMKAPTPRDYVRVIDRTPAQQQEPDIPLSWGITDDDVPF